MMNYCPCLLLISMLLALGTSTSAQEEWARIPLEKQMGKIEEIQQLADVQGNLLFKLLDGSNCQFSLLQESQLVASQTIPLGSRVEFLSSLYDDDFFSLFYRNKKDKKVYTYPSDKQSLPEQLSPTNVASADEKYLASSFCQGDFLVFQFTKSPFALHTYRYEEGTQFEKQSQTFELGKGERKIIGRILTPEEAIFIRTSLNPLVFYVYRYSKGKGFEKKSFNLREIYAAAGIRGNRVFLSDETLYELSRNIDLVATIQGDDIYLDMDHLLHINALVPYYKRPFPGVLRLNWESATGEVLFMKATSNFKFTNRSVALVDSFYLSFLVNKDSLELSVFDVRDTQLIQRYTYNQEDQIDFIQGTAKLAKTTVLYGGIAGILSFPMPVNLNRQGKEITGEALLKHLSVGDIYIEVYNEPGFLELQFSGVRWRTIFVEQVLTTSFVGYFSKPDLGIMENMEDLSPMPWTKVDSYLQELSDTKSNLGEVLVYTYQDRIHVAYIDNKEEVCKIVVF